MIQGRYEPRFLSRDQLEGVSLLGISGEAGSGKSTMAKFLYRTFGFVPEALANPFKKDGVMQANLPVGEVFGSHKSPETRAWLQKRGTEESRDIAGEDVWVHYLELDLLYNLDHGVDRYLVTDVRFPNEVRAIQSLGGMVYRLEGRGGASGAAGGHRSERSLDGFEGFDAFLDNSPGREREVFRDLTDFVIADFGIYPDFNRGGKQ